MNHDSSPFVQIVAKGFDPMITPDLIRESVLEKCGFQPRMENTQVLFPEMAVLCVVW
jgi:seryl-tRNA synthetase